MDAATPSSQGAAFLIRLWTAPGPRAEGEWRGQIKSLQTGEVRYFRQMKGLEGALEALIQAQEHGNRPPGVDP